MHALRGEMPNQNGIERSLRRLNVNQAKEEAKSDPR